MASNNNSNNFFIGTAAWNIPSIAKERFSPEGTHLQRYSKLLNSVEINSCFYREHMPSTYAKWARDVPENFKFCAKLLKVFTHEQKLAVDQIKFKEVLTTMMELGNKFGVLLVQLPPKLEFDRDIVSEFFAQARQVFQANIALEPRNLTWRHRDALQLFKEYKISKVIADPERCPVVNLSEWQQSNIVYYRLHGSPEIYKSDYSAEFLTKISDEMKKWPKEKDVFCLFDNTARGFASEDALEIKDLLRDKNMAVDAPRDERHNNSI